MKEVVPDALAGARAELAVRSLFDLPRGAARRLCEAGRVRLDGKRAKKGDPVRAGSVVELVGGSAWLAPDAAPAARVHVLFASDDVLIVDKPRGVPCHPLVPGEGGTLVDALVLDHPEIATASPDAREAGLVHRLDTDTSGCTAIARSRAAYTRLRAAFDEARVEKRYFALVEGRLEAPIDIDDPIAHDPRDPRRMRAGVGLEGGRDARTRATPLSVGARATAVVVDADRGRRHQVRVHLAARGHPLVGDVLYGAALTTDELAGHALHAVALTLPGAPRVVAPVPADLVAAAAALGCVFPAEPPPDRR